jgi:hypothetical protein
MQRLIAAGEALLQNLLLLCLFIPFVKTHTLTSWSSSLTHLSLSCRGDVNCGLFRVAVSPFTPPLLLVTKLPAAVVQCELSLAARHVNASYAHMMLL